MSSICPRCSFRILPSPFDAVSKKSPRLATPNFPIETSTCWLSPLDFSPTNGFIVDLRVEGSKNYRLACFTNGTYFEIEAQEPVNVEKIICWRNHQSDEKT